jgi:hypothetical protein
VFFLGKTLFLYFGGIYWFLKGIGWDSHFEGIELLLLYCIKKSAMLLKAGIADAWNGWCW